MQPTDQSQHEKFHDIILGDELWDKPYYAEYPRVNIVRWNLQIGDTARKGDNLLTVETDKASIDIESAVDGLLHKIFIPDGGRIQRGAVIGRFEKQVFDERQVVNPNKTDSFAHEANDLLAEISDAIDNGYRDLKCCLNCGYRFPTSKSDTFVPICTMCGSTKNATEQKIRGIGVGILCWVGSAVVGFLGTFMGPFVVIAWLVSVALAFHGISFFFSFLLFLARPIFILFWKFCWGVSLIFTQKGTSSNFQLTRGMPFILVIIVVFLSLLFQQ